MGWSSLLFKVRFEESISRCLWWRRFNSDGSIFLVCLLVVRDAPVMLGIADGRRAKKIVCSNSCFEWKSLIMHRSR